jgi:putative oxidoreductase
MGVLSRSCAGWRRNEEPNMQFLGQGIGRFLLAFIFLFSGARKVMGYQGTLSYMQSKGVFPAMDIFGYPLVEILLMATIAVEIVGGLMLVTGIGARFAALALAAFTVAAGVLFHDFWTIADAAQYGNQLNHFLKNLAIVGGLLIVASQPSRDDLLN